MEIFVKIALSIGIILAATGVARRFPSAAGLIGVMPLTGALVLAWVYWEHQGDARIMQNFARGALWGILPSMLFFLVALLCLKRDFSLTAVLAASFAAWFVAAILHQWALK